MRNKTLQILSALGFAAASACGGATGTLLTPRRRPLLLKKRLTLALQPPCTPKSPGARDGGYKLNNLLGFQAAGHNGKTRKNDRGVALLMSMWALVMLTVVALNFSLSTRAGSAGARNFKEDTNAYYLAESVYEEAIDYLLSDTEPNYDYLDEDGNLRVDDEHPPITGEREVQGAHVVLNITDEESRVNINKVTAQTMTRLLEFAEVPADASAIIMDSLADWMDKDNITRPAGAEDDYYETLGYKTKPGKIEVPEELLLVKGFTPDYLYGSEHNPALYNYITTWGDGVVNFNTISEELLLALGLNTIEVESIIRKRPLKQSPGGLHLAAKPMSSYFRVTVAATMPQNTQTVRITAIVKRDKDEHGVLKAIPVYWREDVENSGA